MSRFSRLTGALKKLARAALTLCYGCAQIARFLLTGLIVGLMGCVVVLLSVYAIIHSQFDGSAQLPADCAVVFGAAVYGNMYPGPAITRRVAAAAALQREGSVNRLIFSGGTGTGNAESEASVMRTLALELGVPADVITLEENSHSTLENIRNSRPLTEGCSSVVGISDQYHLARIELLSWREGWGELQTVPAQDRPPSGSENRSVMREVFAYIYYGLYLQTLFPDLAS